MKHFITALSLLLLHQLCSAQSPAQLQLLATSDSLLTFTVAADSVIGELAAEAPDDTSEGGGIRAFRRWARFAEERVCSNTPQGEDRMLPYGKGLKNYLKSNGSFCQTDPNGWKGNWQCLGPYINSYHNGTEFSGRVDALWVHPRSA